MAQSNLVFENVPTPKLATEEAYDNILAEIVAVPDEELTTVNIDVVAAVTTVIGSLPEIKAFRSSIEAEWRNFDFVQFDKLETYALALNHAHSLYRGAFAPRANVIELAADLGLMRDRMLSNAQSLASLGLINGERLKTVKTVTGYKALASDVLTLGTVFKEHWSNVEGKTPYTPAELHRSGSAALELLTAVGLREQTPVLVGEAALTRQRAFTLFVRAYDEARRAVHYLRAKAGDADRIAPSLYAGRTVRRRNGEQEVIDTAAAPNASANGAEAAAPAIIIDNRAGLPVDNPFTS